MKVTYSSKDEIIGWQRTINFTYQDKEYEVKFIWDGYVRVLQNWVENGIDILKPDWVKNYKSDRISDHTGEWGLFVDLDILSYMYQNEVKA